MNNNVNPQDLAPSGSVSRSAPPKTRSKIWPYFNVCMLTNDGKPWKAKCIYNNCESEFFCKNSSTDSMGFHLRQDHSFDHDYNPLGSLSNTTRSTTIQVSDYLFQSQIKKVFFSLCLHSNEYLF